MYELFTTLQVSFSLHIYKCLNYGILKLHTLFFRPHFQRHMTTLMHNLDGVRQLLTRAIILHKMNSLATEAHFEIYMHTYKRTPDDHITALFAATIEVYIRTQTVTHILLMISLKIVHMRRKEQSFESELLRPALNSTSSLILISQSAAGENIWMKRKRSDKKPNIKLSTPCSRIQYILLCSDNL
jgi:hypothetical protein